MNTCTSMSKIDTIREDINFFRKDNITFLPSLHWKMEFGLWAWHFFNIDRPDAIAIELPSTIKEAVLKAVKRLPHLSVITYQTKKNNKVCIVIEPQDSMVISMQLALAEKIPIYFIDHDTESYPAYYDYMPDSYAVFRIGLKAYVKAFTENIKEQSCPEDSLRELSMAWHLKKISKKYNNILCVLGIKHYKNVMRLIDKNLAQPLSRITKHKTSIYNLNKESIGAIMQDIPYLAYCFEKSIQDKAEPVLEKYDRIKLIGNIFEKAAENYFKNHKEKITPSQFRVLDKFSMNYAIVEGSLTPGIYQMTVAARGAVDDNFAYEVWNIAASYDFQNYESELPGISLSPEDIGFNSQKITFHFHSKNLRHRLLAISKAREKQKKDFKKWMEEWQTDVNSICSFQPEDIIIENFGNFIKQKAFSGIKEIFKPEPFSVSMLEGIDMRETLRNFHKKQIYVQKKDQSSGKVGSIVIIFNEDTEAEEKYPWKVTWLGENSQESDMAFYSTRDGSDIVGPGICKCEYGGLLLSYPPLRMYDIWQDAYFSPARTKPELLLMAGIDYSKDKIIAYVAASPPPEWLKRFAGRYRKKIVYIPIGGFSSSTLRKIRIFHVLNKKEVRNWAEEYIFS